MFCQRIIDRESYLVNGKVSHFPLSTVCGLPAVSNVAAASTADTPTHEIWLCADCLKAISQ
jgi:hypothetical protein